LATASTWTESCSFHFRAFSIATPQDAELGTRNPKVKKGNGGCAGGQCERGALSQLVETPAAPCKGGWFGAKMETNMFTLNLLKEK
jgi:hypothetical protein